MPLRVTRVPKQQLFADSIESILAELGYLDVIASVQPVVLVGRAIARGPPDTQTFDEIIDSSERVRVTEVGATPLQAIVDTGMVAGNAALSSALVVDSLEYELLALRYSYNCDATVATRTTAAAKLTGLYGGFASGVAAKDDYSSSTLSLTASQDGHVSLLAGGRETKNQNGTLTYTSSLLQLPLRVLNDEGFGISVAAATNGVLGDIHRAVLYGRRITS